MFILADFIAWGNAWWAISGTLGILVTVLVWLYADALKSRLSPHVESTLDLIGRKASGRLERIGRLFRKPPSSGTDAVPPVLASRVSADPPPNWHDWTEGEIPALRIRASWAWGRDGAQAQPRCPACDAPLDVRVAGGQASGDPLRTRIACPTGDFKRDVEGTPNEFMKSLNQEVNRMRDQGEWSSMLRPGEGTHDPIQHDR
jgi:hypothetical protein